MRAFLQGDSGTPGTLLKRLPKLDSVALLVTIPGGALLDAKLARPTSKTDLIRYWTLNSTDLAVAARRCDNHSRFGCTLQFCAFVGGLLEQSLETATIDAQAGMITAGWHDHGQDPGSVHGRFVKWHTIGDLAGSVTEDVGRIRSHPLVPGSIPIYGYIYDVATGRLVEVEAAARAGASTS